MNKLEQNIYKHLIRNKTINGKTYSPYESRSKHSYDLLLFPENPIEGLGDFGYWYVNISLMMMGRSPAFEFQHYSLGTNRLENFSVVTGQELKLKLGAQKEFFKPGHVIIDLGNGAGLAKHQYQHFHKKSHLIGLDLNNGNEYPAYDKEDNFVGGSWLNLPFSADSIDGVLACETFPKHAWSAVEIDQTIEELTRVCKVNSVFRATLSEHQSIEIGETDLVNTANYVTLGFVNHGWEVYRSPLKIISKLIQK